MQFAERNHNVDESRPLIYMWEIRDKAGELVGRYIGKAKGGAERPRTQYRRNVTNVLAKKPYRKSKPTEFRKVHHALAEAQKLGHTVVLSFICNVQPGENINDVERRCIKEHNCKGGESWQLNG